MFAVHSLFLQKAVHTFVLPHEDHVLPVQPNVESAPYTAAHPDQREHEQFLGVEGEVHGEVGREHRRDRFLSLKPDSEQPEHGCPANGREEPPPIIPHREVNRGYLDAEQDAADGGREAGGHPHGARSGEHLAVPALVLVDPLEARHQFGEEGGNYARDVHERTFLAQRQTGAQGRGQTYHLLDIRRWLYTAGSKCMQSAMFRIRSLSPREKLYIHV